MFMNTILESSVEHKIKFISTYALYCSCICYDAPKAMRHSQSIHEQTRVQCFYIQTPATPDVVITCDYHFLNMN